MAGKFKEGDVLVVVDASMCAYISVGDTVSVIKGGVGFNADMVTIMDNRGEENRYYEHRFKLLEPELVVGVGTTMVVTIASYPLAVGDTFVVTADVNNHNWRYSWTNNDGYVHKNFHHPKNKCKPLVIEGTTDMTISAKAGDTVLVEGVLTRGPDSDGDFAIRFQGKTLDQFVPATAIRKVTAVAPILPKFKKGDKVRMNTGKVASADRNARGTILADPHDGVYFIEWSGGWIDGKKVNTIKEVNLLPAAG